MAAVVPRARCAPATHADLVEIEPETFEVLRFVIAEECGRVINPLVADTLDARSSALAALSSDRSVT